MRVVNRGMNNIMKEKSDYYIPCVNEFSIENNPYSSIMVDITQRCNLKCNVCFNPVHSNKFDMDIEYFEDVCKRLPNKVVWKLLGGEPTMHKDFFKFLDISHKYGHSTYFSSNGLMYLDDQFMEKLAALPYKVLCGITLDGGLSNEKAYEVIDGRPLLESKMKALDNLAKYNINRVVISAIIVRNLNEDVIGELVKLSNETDNIKYVVFRNVGKGGQWIDTDPYSTQELKELMATHYQDDQLKMASLYGEVCVPPSTNDCCFRFRPSKRLQVTLIESVEEDAVDCPYKGRLIDEKFVIQSFHESLIQTGKKMESQFGEIKIE